MGINLKNEKGKNLYDFWSSDITNCLNDTLKKHKNPTILNCASNEYFNVIDKNGLKGNVLNTIFKEKRNGELKFISFNAKKARGLLAKFVINNGVDSKEGLKEFNLEDYKFNSKISEENTFVFTR